LISKTNEVIGVFDLDSIVVDTFHSEDKEFLESVVKLAITSSDWPQH